MILSGGTTYAGRDPATQKGAWQGAAVVFNRRGGKEYQEKGLAYNLVKEIAEVDHDIDIWHQVEYHVDPLRSNPNKDMGWALADAQWQSTQAI